MRWPFLIAATGCIDVTLDPVHDDPAPERALVTDTFVQAPLPAVDLLFVIDDTASMAQEQAALGDQFDALSAELTAAGVQWHAGVVTTDMTVPTAGWLRGSPWILTPDLPDPAAAFAAAALVGTAGARPEAGLAAAERALDLTDPGEPNAGFRRHEAALHLIFVSDTDDASDTWLGADPVGEFTDWLALEAGNGLPVTVSAVVGDVPAGCSSTLGTAAAAPRYHALAAVTSGAVVSICDVDLTDVIAGLGRAALAYPTRFPLRAAPADGTARVTVDGVRLSDGFTVEATPTAADVVFDAPPPAGAEIVVAYVVEVL